MSARKEIIWTQIDCTLAKRYGYDVDELVNQISKMQREACRYNAKYSVVRFVHFQGKEYGYIKVETTWPLYDKWIARLKQMHPGMCDYRFDDEMEDE